LLRRQAIVPKARAASPPPNAAASAANIYEQAVEACRRLANHQWEIGDWAIKVSAEAKYGAKTLERFADDIGIDYATLREYQSVAKAWFEIVGRPTIFGVAKALVTHPNRAALAANDPHMTVADARDIMRAYKAESNVVPING
jgi:predicted solute-binding protein